MLRLVVALAQRERRRAVGGRLGRGGRAAPQQQRDDGRGVAREARLDPLGRQVAVGDGAVQRGEAGAVGARGVGAGGEQRLAQVEPAVVGGEHQRRAPLLDARVGRRAALEHGGEQGAAQRGPQALDVHRERERVHPVGVERLGPGVGRLEPLAHGAHARVVLGAAHRHQQRGDGLGARLRHVELRRRGTALLERAKPIEVARGDGGALSGRVA